MADNRDPEAVRLSEEAARRLIKRATELDATLSTESSVAELRHAAQEAGISPQAFQRALDEARAESLAPLPATGASGAPARRRLWPVVLTVIIGVMLLFVTMRLVAPVRSPPIPAGSTPNPIQAPPTIAPPPTTPLPSTEPTTPTTKTKTKSAVNKNPG